MKKELITFEELAVLSFLKFAKLDEIDMTLLIKSISSIADIEIKDDSSEYFITKDGNVILEKSYIEKFNKNVDIELFENISGYAVQKYIGNINMREFVLRKIKLLGPGCVVKDDISNSFSIVQIRAINKLYQEKYIMDYWHKDDIYGDYEAIKLTKRGELELFLIDNQQEVSTFAKLLSHNGYNSLLIEPFLITQDLGKKSVEVLTLDNFIEFYNEYDVNPYIDNFRQSNYSRKKVPEKIQ